VTWYSYKLVTTKADYWGIQSKVENLVLKGHADIFLLSHRNVFAWLDDWVELSMDVVERMEEARSVEIDLSIDASGVLRGRSVSAAEGEGSSGSDDEDDDDVFFDAAEEWGAERDLQALAPLTTGAGVAPACGVCADTGENTGSSQLFNCRTCQEIFCAQHFAAFHRSRRLRMHDLVELSSEARSTVSSVEVDIEPHRIALDHEASGSHPPDWVGSGGDNDQVTLSYNLVTSLRDIIMSNSNPTTGPAHPGDETCLFRGTRFNGQCVGEFASMRETDWKKCRTDPRWAKTCGFVDALSRCSPRLLQHEQRLAFWLNTCVNTDMDR